MSAERRTSHIQSENLVSDAECCCGGVTHHHSPTSVRGNTSNGMFQTLTSMMAIADQTGAQVPTLRSPGTVMRNRYRFRAGHQSRYKSYKTRVRRSPAQPAFCAWWQAYVKEVAQDELDHVLFLQTALAGAAVKMPEINMCAALAPPVCSRHFVTAGCRLPLHSSAHHVQACTHADGVPSLRAQAAYCTWKAVTSCSFAHVMRTKRLAGRPLQ